MTRKLSNHPYRLLTLMQVIMPLMAIFFIAGISCKKTGAANGGGGIPTAAHTYYVTTLGNDNNNGSETSPWKTLAKVSSTTFSPGDLILFHTGDIFIGQLNINSSGTSGLPIKFGSYGTGSKPVINGSTSSGGDYESAVFINNQQYIEIRDLDISNNRTVSRSGASDSSGYGVYLLNNGTANMNYYRFTNLTVQNVFAIVPGQAGNGIFVTAQKNSAGSTSNINDVIVDSCYVTNTALFGIATVASGGNSIQPISNFIIRNCNTYKTGGSGIRLSRVYNGLVEHNDVEYAGSSGGKLYGRGSGAWYFGSTNVLSQYNISRHARGSDDSYGQHIDFGNNNVILQYNYSQDSEGGFVEILGDNKNCAFRYNISVNDGLIRSNNRNTIWLSDFASPRTPSDSIYIYGNSIYVGDNLNPGISIKVKNAFIFNNIFYAATGASIGDSTSITISSGSNLIVANNLFYGNVNLPFVSMSINSVTGDPKYIQPGDTLAASYKLLKGSIALNKGSTAYFFGPLLPGAGAAGSIFQNVPVNKINLATDFFGNNAGISGILNIGAYNGSLN